MTGRFGHSKRIGRAALSSLAALVMLSAMPAVSATDAAMLQENRGSFRIVGNRAKQSCAAQTDQPSRAGKSVSMSIYWKPGISADLLFRHPDVDASTGKAKLRFQFPDGTDLTFRMTPVGTILQMPLGLAHNVPALFHAVKTNARVEIDIIGISDKLDLDLAQWTEVKSAMEACGKWLN